MQHGPGKQLRRAAGRDPEIRIVRGRSMSLPEKWVPVTLVDRLEAGRARVVLLKAASRSELVHQDKRALLTNCSASLQLVAGFSGPSNLPGARRRAGLSAAVSG